MDGIPSGPFEHNGRKNYLETLICELWRVIWDDFWKLSELDFDCWKCIKLIIGGLIGGLIVDDEKWVESSEFVELGWRKVEF